MSLTTLDAAQASALLAKGALLVDIRDGDEHVRERIPGARNIPLSRLCDGGIDASGQAVIFHCKSGNRTRMNAELLLQASPGSAHVMEGGIEAWKRAGLPVLTDRRQPIEMMRQVQIAAGSLALAGAILGYTVSPGFYALSGAVGAGLVFAGVTGTCAMAHILRLMPWNRRAA
ncbi:MAG: DUF2892 domain-containing protein [Proteobacteria bacterium]|nr:DUF2892 domain-containing protein [Pseudomonadota bacterium]